MEEGSYLSIGTHLGEVQLWDGVRCKKVRTMGGHTSRTSVLAWSSRILASGSRDRNILQHDICVSNDFVSKLVGHKSEVCGLKWSLDDKELASGGNDNQLLVWKQRSQQPVLKLTEHTAAVKTIAWSPHQNGLIASGGGTADRCIHFCNTTNGWQLNHVDTGSQVCNLAWNKNVNEIVSTHGYSQNRIMLWKYPLMGKVATLTGHNMRVLYLAMSPDGQTIVTGAGDETLRFWNAFPPAKSQVENLLDRECVVNNASSTDFGSNQSHHEKQKVSSSSCSTGFASHDGTRGSQSHEQVNMLTKPATQSQAHDEEVPATPTAVNVKNHSPVNRSKRRELLQPLVVTDALQIALVKTRKIK